MSTEQEANKAVVMKFNKEFIERGDLAVFHETVDPGFINRTAHPGEADGPEATARFITDVLRPAFSDLEVIVEDLVAEGDKVVTRKTYRGTHGGELMGIPATGRSIEFSVIDIIRLRDGRYVEHWAVADMAGLHAQLLAP
jgi:predicted ester cyclase